MYGSKSVVSCGINARNSPISFLTTTLHVMRWRRRESYWRICKEWQWNEQVWSWFPIKWIIVSLITWIVFVPLTAGISNSIKSNALWYRFRSPSNWFMCVHWKRGSEREGDQKEKDWRPRIELKMRSKWTRINKEMFPWVCDPYFYKQFINWILAFLFSPPSSRLSIHTLTERRFLS